MYFTFIKVYAARFVNLQSKRKDGLIFCDADCC